MNPISWIINLFKKEGELNYPYEFGIVKLTDVAKNNNINDDLNKVICVYRNGKEIMRKPYTEEEVKNITEIMEIPIIPEEISNDFDFYQESNFGEVGS